MIPPRPVVFLICLMTLVLATAPAIASSTSTSSLPTASLAVKGFVVSRSDWVLTVRGGDGTPMRVILSPATVVAGARIWTSEIAVNDLIRVEGVAAEGDGLQAQRVDVILRAGDPTLVRQHEQRPNNMLLSWIMNGSLSVPLP